MTNSVLPLFVAIPLGSAFVISLLGKKVRWFSAFCATLAMLAMLFISIFSIYLLKTSGVLLYEVGNWPMPFGIAMVLDGLTGFMLITVNLIAFLKLVTK